MSAEPHLQQSFFELEQRLLERNVGTSELVAIIDDDFIEFGKSGRVYDKRSVIAVLASGPRTSGATITDFKVMLLEPTVSLVTYRLMAPASDPIDSLRSSVWRSRDGRWRLMFHQGTPTSPASRSH